jgi:hypothetical protein
MKLHFFRLAIAMTLTLTLSLAVTQNAKAQDYHNAIGLRADYSAYGGITYKQFLDEKAAFELIANGRFYTYYSGFGITGLYQIHNDFKDAGNLKWYYGGGASLALYSYDIGYGTAGAGAQFGLAGCLGLDFRIPNVPITLSLDWIPRIYLTGGGGFVGGGGGLAVRYVLSDK